MGHIHGVFDSDAHFIIDPITRHLKNETSKKASVVQYDHYSERFTFELPKLIEGHDMTKCNVVQVHYLNIEAKTKKEHKGLYEVTDLQISPEDDNTVICSWLISQNATQLSGSISFLVRFACVNEGKANYIWQTAPFTAITVTTGINNSDFIVEEYADILQQWKKELEELAAIGGGLTKVTWEDIENKPFGDIKHFDDVVRDENATDRVVTEEFSIPNIGDGFCFVKVGELPATPAEYLSKIDTVHISNGQTYNKAETLKESATGWAEIKESAGAMLNVWGICFVVAAENDGCVILENTFPEKGVYVLYNNAIGFGVSEVTFREFVQINESYMPESYETIKDDVEQLKEDVKNATPDDYEELKEDVETLKEDVETLGKADYIPNIKASEGDFLCFSGGEWSAKTIPNAEGATF